MRNLQLIILLLFTSCTTSNMEDIYRESFADSADGYIKDVIFSKGGSGILTISQDSAYYVKIGVDKSFRDLVKKGNYFIKEKNSNKCIIEKNDSIIFLDCYNIPQDVRDSIGKIEEWPKDKKGYWQLKAK